MMEHFSEYSLSDMFWLYPAWDYNVLGVLFPGLNFHAFYYIKKTGDATPSKHKVNVQASKSTFAQHNHGYPIILKRRGRN